MIYAPGVKRKATYNVIIRGSIYPSPGSSERCKYFRNHQLAKFFERKKMIQQRSFNQDCRPIPGIICKPLTTFLMFLILAFVFPTTLMAGDGANWDRLIEKAQGEGSVRVIVQLKSDSSLDGDLSTTTGQAKRQEVMQNLQERLLNSPAMSGLNVSSVKTFSFIPFLALEVDAAALEGLQSDPNVAGIQEDVAEPPLLMDSVPLIGADQTHNQGFAGTGQAVAILDTGVDKSHAFFGNRVVEEACYSTTTAPGSSFPSVTVCPDGKDESTASGSGVNCNSSEVSSSCDHGTHVAGIAAGDNGSGMTGVAPDAELISIQVFSKFGEEVCGTSACLASWTSDQIKGLERVLALSTTMNIASVNMSLGGGLYFSPCDSSEPARKAIIDLLRSAGIATVVASGNASQGSALAAPACISSAISVACTYKNTTLVDQVCWFSNTADFLDLMAPGYSIQSSVPGGGFGSKSGTSMSAPHAAGTWAVLKQSKPTASVSEILTALQNTGEPIFDPLNGQTYPRIQVDAALTELGGGGGTPPPPPENRAPIADAGPNQTHLLANVGDTVNVALDGSGSSDPDGDPLTYAWTLPNGTSSAVNPTVNLGQGTYTINLVVNDGKLNSTMDSVVITVNDPNVPPPPTPGTLNVSSDRGLKARGKQGKGPFNGSITYTITNDGDSDSAAINYSVSGSNGWVQVTNKSNGNSVAGGIMSGSLEPGDSVDIMVDVSQDPAKSLSKGKHNGVVTITNESSGDVETRKAQLNVN